MENSISLKYTGSWTLYIADEEIADGDLDEGLVDIAFCGEECCDHGHGDPSRPDFFDEATKRISEATGYALEANGDSGCDDFRTSVYWEVVIK